MENYYLNHFRKRIMVLLVMIFCIPFGAVAQEYTLKGRVVDGNNVSIPGVNIQIKGKLTGAVSGLDGDFSLRVSTGETLIVSFVGYLKQEILIADQNDLLIVMKEESESLEEVVVVAYGTTKKEAYTGSASNVKGNEVMRNASPISAEKALQGYVAGIRVSQSDGQPGSSATLNIRGIGSINGNTQPLYVIDGVPIVSGDLSNVMASTNIMSSLNPNDIESMTVLKDAAATSLYGSRAANGVVIITTKSGKSGKTIFDVSYEKGFTTTAMPHEIYGLYMSGRQYTEYSLDGLKNRYLYDRLALPGQANYDVNNSIIQDDALNYAYNNLNSKAKIIHPDDKLDGTFSYATADRDKYLSNARNTNWADKLFKVGSENRFDFSAKGGSEKNTFYTSLGYLDQEGLFDGSNFKRVSGNVNLNNKVNEYVKFGLNQTLSQSKQEGTSSGGYYANPIWGLKNLNPTAPIYNDDGSFYKYPGFITKIPNYVKNNQEQGRMSETFRSLTNLNLTFTFTDWLSFKTVNGLDYIHMLEKSYAGIDSHDGRNEKGTLYEYAKKHYDLTTSNVLNFNKTFNDHSLSVLVGFEAKKSRSDYFSAYATGFISDQFLELSNAAIASEVEGAFDDDRLVSYLSKVDYNYKGKYYASVNIRKDASSRLSKDNRWGSFWATSVGWTISREEFIKKYKWIDMLRLKASYGTTGNLPEDFYKSQSLYGLSGKYNNNSIFLLKNIGNPYLTWEKSYTWNVGFDFSVFKKLSGVLEYYNKLTDDLLNDVPVSYNTGFESVLVNEGKLRNTGIELTLSSKNIEGAFTWSTDLNISYMKSIVEELNDDIVLTRQIYREGEPLYSFYLREWAGVDPATGTPLWYKNTYGPDGKTPIKDGSTTSNVSEANRVVLAKAYPDYYGGITNRFTYKRFEFSFLFTFTLGGMLNDDLARLTDSDGKYIGTYAPTIHATDGVWKNPGDNASAPINIYGNPYNTQERSSRYLHSSDHLRLKNVSLSYSFPEKWLTRIKVSSAKIYVNANDILTFYKYNYINPEVNYDGNTNGGSYYPALKSFRVGISLQF